MGRRRITMILITPEQIWEARARINEYHPGELRLWLLRAFDIIEASWAERDALQAKHGEAPPINIIFDGPPSHDAGRFVEVETDDGRSVNVGEWKERPDGLWALRIIR
jgi:hypothetical protein